MTIRKTATLACSAFALSLGVTLAPAAFAQQTMQQPAMSGTTTTMPAPAMAPAMAKDSMAKDTMSKDMAKDTMAKDAMPMSPAPMMNDSMKK